MLICLRIKKQYAPIERRLGAPKRILLICGCGSVHAEGFQRAIADVRLFSLPFGRSRRSEIPCLRKKSTTFERPAARSRPSGATQHRCWNERLGGASEEAQSYWQGRFAACAFCWTRLAYWSPAERLGRCPKPHQRRCLWTPQGALPLDPFFVARLERFSLRFG